MHKSISKKVSQLSAWDLDKGCRNFIDSSTPARRRLKKKIRTQDRKRLDKYFTTWYNNYESEG